MAAKEVSKKKYLKILNKRLRAEPAAPAGASFVFSRWVRRRSTRRVSCPATRAASANWR